LRTYLYPPSRIIVGEVRQEECLDLLIALNNGVPGMATLHANTAREAIIKMCTLPLLAGENVTSAFVVPTVAACIDLVVHIRAEPNGARRIHEIIGVPGRVEDGIIETAEIFVRKDGQLARASGYPPRPEQFAGAGFDLGELLHAGLPTDVESATAALPQPGRPSFHSRCAERYAGVAPVHGANHRGTNCLIAAEGQARPLGEQISTTALRAWCGRRGGNQPWVAAERTLLVAVTTRQHGRESAWASGKHHMMGHTHDRRERAGGGSGAADIHGLTAARTSRPAAPTSFYNPSRPPRSLPRPTL
jgi:Type II/IV secretion system protein